MLMPGVVAGDELSAASRQRRFEKGESPRHLKIGSCALSDLSKISQTKISNFPKNFQNFFRGLQSRDARGAILASSRNLFPKLPDRQHYPANLQRRKGLRSDDLYC